MSDDDDMGDNDFDNDYDDDDDQEQPDDDLENQYYHSEALYEDDPNAALEGFKNVLILEKDSGTKGDWGFKSLEHMIKIYLKKKNFEQMLTCYRDL